MDITASTAYEWTAIHHAEHDCLHIVTLFLIYIKINIPHEFWWLFSISSLEYAMLFHWPLQNWLSGPCRSQHHCSPAWFSPSTHPSMLLQAHWEDGPGVLVQPWPHCYCGWVVATAPLTRVSRELSCHCWVPYVIYLSCLKLLPKLLGAFCPAVCHYSLYLLGKCFWKLSLNESCTFLHSSPIVNFIHLSNQEG